MSQVGGRITRARDHGKMSRLEDGWKVLPGLDVHEGIGTNDEEEFVRPIALGVQPGQRVRREGGLITQQLEIAGSPSRSPLNGERSHRESMSGRGDRS